MEFQIAKDGFAEVCAFGAGHLNKHRLGEFRGEQLLEKRGVIFRKTERDDDRFYVMGDAESRSCHIHMVPADGRKWRNYIAFRDYLNVNPDAAGRYCVLKRELAGRYADDREAYTEGKAGLITRLLNEARTWKNAE